MSEKKLLTRAEIYAQIAARAKAQSKPGSTPPAALSAATLAAASAKVGSDSSNTCPDPSTPTDTVASPKLPAAPPPTPQATSALHRTPPTGSASASASAHTFRPSSGGGLSSASRDMRISELEAKLAQKEAEMESAKQKAMAYVEVMASRMFVAAFPTRRPALRNAPSPLTPPPLVGATGRQKRSGEQAEVRQQVA